MDGAFSDWVSAQSHGHMASDGASLPAATDPTTQPSRRTVVKALTLCLIANPVVGQAQKATAYHVGVLALLLRAAVVQPVFFDEMTQRLKFGLDFRPRAANFDSAPLEIETAIARKRSVSA